MTPYSLIIPAYNEGERITNLFYNIGNFDGEIIVVCDGSNDNTTEVMDRIISENPTVDIRYIWKPTRLGKGKAVELGIRESKYDRVSYLDSDGSVTVKQMNDMVQFLDQYHAVIGSRWMLGTSDQPVIRRIESRVLNLITRHVFGLPFYDTQCGAKAFRKESVMATFPLATGGFEFDIEILYRMTRNGCNILEMPVIWNDAPCSKVRAKDAMNMFTSLMALWRRTKILHSHTR